MRQVSFRRWSVSAVLLSVTMLCGGEAMAEATTLRVALQPSLSFVPLMIMKHDNLIQKKAKAAGLGDIRVEWPNFSSAAAVSDAIISGSLDIAVSGTPGLILLWDRTGAGNGVRGIAAVNSVPLTLNTVDANVKSIKDFKPTDRIGIPAPKVSVQAIIIQMAAAQAFGPRHFAKIDPLTVPISHPDGAIALLNKPPTITAHMSGPPFQEQELNDPRVHAVFDSYKVLGGPATTNLMWTSTKFHDRNPKLYKAFLSAFEDAEHSIKKDPKRAAEIFIKTYNSSLGLPFVEKILADPQQRYTATPENVMKFARFMYQIKLIKHEPKSWKDLFFPEIHNLPGS